MDTQGHTDAILFGAGILLSLGFGALVFVLVPLAAPRVRTARTPPFTRVRRPRRASATVPSFAGLSRLWQRVTDVARGGLADLTDLRLPRLGRPARRPGSSGLASASLGGITPTKPLRRPAAATVDRLAEMAHLRFFNLRYLARVKPELVWGLAAGALAVGVGVLLGLYA